MLSRVAGRLADLAQRFVPDPFVIALGLTALAFAIGWAAMPAPDPRALAEGWLGRVGASGTLTFTCQMALMLVAGTTLARAPLVARVLARLAERPRTTRGAAAMTAVVSMLAAYLNWGFGLIAGAVLAREIGERAARAGRRLNYPLVAAAGYVGLMVWHGGLSGSAPLKVADEGVAGLPTIGLEGTIFSTLNLTCAALLLVIVPLVVSRMASADDDRTVEGVGVAPTVATVDRTTVSQRVLLVFIIALGVTALAGRVSDAGLLRSVGINTVNLTLLLLGLVLYGSPLRFARAFTSSTGEAGGILLQFPFYFGILGLLESSGLVQRLAENSAGLAQALSSLGPSLQWSFDVVIFSSAALVNLFVPSGGGQWAVQGTIVATAAEELRLSVPRAVMALAYGDQWTNMLQPFWALPLLGITGLKARDILGYTLTIMLAALPVFLLAFALL